MTQEFKFNGYTFHQKIILHRLHCTDPYTVFLLIFL
jgi:hypothetical protein